MNVKLRWIIAFALLALGPIVMTSVSSAAPGDPAPDQGQVCTWEQIGRTSPGHFHVASASDTIKHMVYYYGGADQSQEAVSYFGVLDVSDPDINNASGPSSKSVSGAQQRMGAVGIYRPGANPDSDATLMWVGGARDNGQGTDTVQTYDISGNNWTPNANPTGSFNARLYHAGAFDTANDVGVYHGGTPSCAISDTDCSGGNFGTTLLEFDAMTGMMSWRPLSISDTPGRVFGHSMVYDAMGQRMLIFGGTTDGNRGKNDVYEMDMSDMSALSWKKLSTSGSAPSARFFHASAYHADKNWMVIYGGVTRGLHSDSENIDANTYALDLTQTPPAWVNLGTDVSDNMGGVMDYDANHKTVVLHGGRGRFQGTGSQRVNTKTFALICADAPTPTNTTVPPTVGPTATGGTGPTAVPPTPTVMAGDVCDIAQRKVPNQVINDAVANPGNYYGYDLLCNPNAPPGPYNQLRRMLSLSQANKPFHPLYNSVEWKCGCP